MGESPKIRGTNQDVNLCSNTNSALCYWEHNCTQISFHFRDTPFPYESTTYQGLYSSMFSFKNYNITTTTFNDNFIMSVNFVRSI